MKNIPNESIIAALLSTSTIKAAAETVGLTERAIYDRMKTPEFRELYKEARQKMLHVATARLQNSVSDAISTLVDVMENAEIAAQTRVNAAMAVLQYCLRYTEAVDFAERMEALENPIGNNNDALSQSLEELALTLESDNV